MDTDTEADNASMAHDDMDTDTESGVPLSNASETDDGVCHDTDSDAFAAEAFEQTLQSSDDGGDDEEEDDLDAFAQETGTTDVDTHIPVYTTDMAAKLVELISGSAVQHGLSELPSHHPLGVATGVVYKSVRKRSAEEEANETEDERERKDLKFDVSKLFGLFESMHVRLVTSEDEHRKQIEELRKENSDLRTKLAQCDARINGLQPKSPIPSARQGVASLSKSPLIPNQSANVRMSPSLSFGYTPPPPSSVSPQSPAWHQSQTHPPSTRLPAPAPAPAPAPTPAPAPAPAPPPPPTKTELEKRMDAIIDKFKTRFRDVDIGTPSNLAQIKSYLSVIEERRKPCGSDAPPPPPIPLFPIIVDTKQHPDQPLECEVEETCVHCHNSGVLFECTWCKKGSHAYCSAHKRCTDENAIPPIPPRGGDAAFYCNHPDCAGSFFIDKCLKCDPPELSSDTFSCCVCQNENIPIEFKQIWKSKCSNDHNGEGMCTTCAHTQILNLRGQGTTRFECPMCRADVTHISHLGDEDEKWTDVAVFLDSGGGGEEVDEEELSVQQVIELTRMEANRLRSGQGALTREQRREYARERRVRRQEEVERKKRQEEEKKRDLHELYVRVNGQRHHDDDERMRLVREWSFLSNDGRCDDDAYADVGVVDEAYARLRAVAANCDGRPPPKQRTASAASAASASSDAPDERRADSKKRGRGKGKAKERCDDDSDDDDNDKSYDPRKVHAKTANKAKKLKTADERKAPSDYPIAVASPSCSRVADAVATEMTEADEASLSEKRKGKKKKKKKNQEEETVVVSTEHELEEGYWVGADGTVLSPTYQGGLSNDWKHDENGNPTEEYKQYIMNLEMENMYENMEEDEEEEE